MTISALSLNGVPLAQCQSFSVRPEWLGGSVVLGNGGLRRDLVSTGMKRRFSLAWVGLSQAEVQAIVGAFGAAVAGDVDFTPLDGVQTTVNAGERASIQFEAVKVAGGLRWRCSCELVEV